MTSDVRLVSFNGELVPETEAKVSIYDSALMFGDMVFEMTRSFDKKQFKLEDHVSRLYAGLKILRIPIELTQTQMIDECHRTVEANDHLFQNDDEHRLMIDVSRGLLGIYQNIEGLHKGTNIIIADFPLRWTVATMGPLFETGINMVITSQRAIPASLMDPKIKNRSRLFYLMANIEASQMAGDNNWALLLGTDGFITEGTGDNFFIVKDGVVITPEGNFVEETRSQQEINDLANLAKEAVGLDQSRGDQITVVPMVFDKTGEIRARETELDQLGSFHSTFSIAKCRLNLGKFAGESESNKTKSEFSPAARVAAPSARAARLLHAPCQGSA